MTDVKALNNFSYANKGFRTWRAYDIGGGQLYSADQLARFETPQGSTRLVTIKTFSNPDVEAGSYLHPAQLPILDGKRLTAE